MSPRVSIVTAAYNLAEYLPRAIDSALAQIPPGGPVEVVVVDDGSDDETPTVIAGYGDRIRSVRQRNAGTNAAVDCGIELASGEYIALLDADDEWPADRLARHVAFLDANPSVGLVHGDMEVIDASSELIAPSYFALTGIKAPSGRVLGDLLAGNFVSGGASTFRASLKAAFHPIPEAAAYHDWTVATCIACVAEIALVGGTANRYRFRGDNDSLGRPTSETARVQRRELPWRRWMFENVLADPTVTVEHLLHAYAGLRFGLLSAAAAEPGGPRALLEPDPAIAAALARNLPAAAIGAPRSKALLRALASDPFDGALALQFELALKDESRFAALPADAPLIGILGRCHTVIGWLDELLANPDLLLAFAAESSSRDATLVVLAPPGGDVGRLVRIFEDNAVLADERCEVIVTAEPQTSPARACLSATASSRLTLAQQHPDYDALEPDAALERLVQRL